MENKIGVSHGQNNWAENNMGEYWWVKFGIIKVKVDMVKCTGLISKLLIKIFFHRQKCC